MAELIAYGKWLAAAEILLMILLLTAMVRRGLARTYKIFFVFMAFQCLCRVAYLFLNPRTNTSARFYFVTTPILWVLSVQVVYELYENILSDYPGIVSFGKWVITATFGAAVGISLLTARYDWNLAAHKSSPIPFYYTFTERGITSAQVFFLIAMTVFLRWFPAPMKRNVHVHTVVLFLYFLCRSSSQLFRNMMGDEVTAATNLVIQAATGMCLIAWIWHLSPEQDDPRVTYRKVDQREEQRILGALRSLNNSLIGAAKPAPKK